MSVATLVPLVSLHTAYHEPKDDDRDTLLLDALVELELVDHPSNVYLLLDAVYVNE